MSKLETWNGLKKRLEIKNLGKFGEAYRPVLSEALESDLEDDYNKAVSQLRAKFQTIPEDLNNKCVTIRYKQDNWVYQNIFLYSDGLVVDKINGKNIVINKIKGERKWSAHSRTKEGLTVIGKFYPYEFAQWINKIIENADKCEIIVKKLDRPRIMNNF